MPQNSPAWTGRRSLLVCVAFAVVAGGAAVAVWQFATHTRVQADGQQAAPGHTNRHRHTNRLINETSPYLLQHAHNPVHWYPWSEEAFARAKKEDKPVFLSVGYSTCYWCHVMERESFENEQVARVLNQHFICIKVDREERPDVDEQYMLATQALSGRGGWPNSVWLTPDGRPWMAGTYFPRERFLRVLASLADIWKNRRGEVEQQADQLAATIRRLAAGQQAPGAGGLDQQLVDQAVQALRRSYDERHGGFGGAPKFPPHGALQLLIHEYRRTKDPALLQMITGTLNAMARGGIRDHVGGGFHRYSTDERWLLPHFEKMLYDNAQLLRAYAAASRLTGNETYREVVAETAAWLRREMTSPEGAFYSAIDSESEHEEGKSYVWTYREVLAVLGPDDGALFARTYGIEPGGNYTEEATGKRPGTNIPWLPVPISEVSRRNGRDPQVLADRLARLRGRLLEVRNRRVAPHRDDKVLTSWNGLMIAALAEAGRTLDEPRYTKTAARAAEFVLQHMMRNGRLLRTWRAGQARLPGYLDDCAFFAEGLLELHLATGEARWLDETEALARVMLTDFHDPDAGGFFFTSRDHPDLLARSKNLLGGGNIPSGNGVAAQVLVRLGRLTGTSRYTEAARTTLDSLAGWMRQSPGSADSLVLAAALWLEKPPRDRPTVAATQKRAAEPQPDARHEQAPLTIEAFASQSTVRPGDTFRVAVALEIDEGWHLYGPNKGVDFVIPSTVSVRPHEFLSAAPVVAPKPKTVHDPVIEQELEVYEGRVWFVVPLMVSKQAAAGKTTLHLDVRTQACDAQRCLAPRTATLDLPLVVDANAAGELRHPSVFKALDRE